ncbi:hypothetical protein I203_105810 [Kwoniella mangroviensis CBS 8507]|uniref:uncharacterized protein n=1 Tax=Kwoniella mangroviensis CBS 8507 TaxID=1296122 RepID=UPI00080D0A4D|nr:uncharacterized protein I203_01622 [Kwoniella mangroviensis CBS 8507]OCF69758.1 hypothetical protein I203_01622 [Kwoniella mangroviensis CBS 8507]
MSINLSRDPLDEVEREPLSSVSLNTPHRITAVAGPSTIKNGTSSSPLAAPSTSTKKLAPIFLTKRRTPTSTSTSIQDTNNENIDPSSSSSSGSPVSRKKIKLDYSIPLGSISLEQISPSSSSSSSSSTPMVGRGMDGGMDIDMDNTNLKNHVRMHSIHDWFLPSTNLNYERLKDGKRTEMHQDVKVDECRNGHGHGVWKRQRKRLGIKGLNSIVMEKHRLITPQVPYLSTLVHSLLPYHPTTPPSLLLLPSIHPPTGRPRDFAPPLSIAFNNIAKNYDATSAKEAGLRRLIAVAGEEGGVRILDVDEGLGSHREEKGFWWRAHGNAIFDLRWSADDTRVLTASGDQSTRLHALTTPTPTLQATLKGHTSSVKTTVFFDPSRSHSDPSTSSSVIASGGRDGNILIYDIRCRGRQNRDIDHDALMVPRGERERYSDGVPGFVAQPPNRGMELNPVMTIRNAHGDGRRNGNGRTATRSVTSLVALQSMPGILASGGSFDGIVKLWDLRFPAPTTRSPEPRPSCTAIGSLPDPTVYGTIPSRRARSINALCESPTTGDLYALCGDSKIHSLRPSSFTHLTDEGSDNKEAIGCKPYTDPNLLVSSFYIRLSISPDGRYLSSGSCKGGVMSWDTHQKDGSNATRLALGMGGVQWPEGKEREVGAVDWGKDMLAAASDDLATRLWRSDRDVARWLKDDPNKASEEWCGSV